MERGELLREFENIPKRRPGGECTIALQPDNGDKNRFQDVLPYDDTRVELVPTKENNTGYINASHIRVSLLKDIVRGFRALVLKDKKMAASSLGDGRWTGLELHRRAGSPLKHVSGLLADGVGTGHLHHRHGYG